MHAYYMLPMFGVPYFEILEADASFDPIAFLSDSAERAEEAARTVKGKGSRRAKADLQDKAELCRLALSTWTPDRLSRSPSGALRISLARVAS